MNANETNLAAAGNAPCLLTLNGDPDRARGTACYAIQTELGSILATGDRAELLALASDRGLNLPELQEGGQR